MRLQQSLLTVGAARVTKARWAALLVVGVLLVMAMTVELILEHVVSSEVPKLLADIAE